MAVLTAIRNELLPKARHAGDTAPVAGARRDIQGLRALAVLAVIANHLFRWPQGGFVGVDVFFVISGYLITALLLRELDLSRYFCTSRQCLGVIGNVLVYHDELSHITDTFSRTLAPFLGAALDSDLPKNRQ